MKRSNYILLSILAIGLMASCAEKKKSKIIIAPKPVAQVTNKPTQEMSGYEQSRDVEWLGDHYKVVVKREADHELPIIQLDKTNKYYDNKITIRILRSMVPSSSTTPLQRQPLKAISIRRRNRREPFWASFSIRQKETISVLQPVSVPRISPAMNIFHWY